MAGGLNPFQAIFHLLLSSLDASPKIQEFGLAFIRSIFGLFMIYHGWEIFQPEKIAVYLEWDIFQGAYGKTAVYFGKFLELTAGVLITLGLFTRFGALIAVVTMGFIALFVGRGRVWYEDQHPFMFVLTAGVFLLLGGGQFSLDHRFWPEKTRKKESY